MSAKQARASYNKQKGEHDALVAAHQAANMAPATSLPPPPLQEAPAPQQQQQLTASQQFLQHLELQFANVMMHGTPEQQQQAMALIAHLRSQQSMLQAPSVSHPLSSVDPWAVSSSSSKVDSSLPRAPTPREEHATDRRMSFGVPPDDSYFHAGHLNDYHAHVGDGAPMSTNSPEPMVSGAVLEADVNARSRTEMVDEEQPTHQQHE